LFPLFLGFLAVIGLVLNSQSLQQSFLDSVSQNLPGAAGLVGRNVGEVVQMWGALGVGSILGLIWSVTGVFGAISRAVNRPGMSRRTDPSTSSIRYGIWGWLL
jgi:uncharacterized BrkB/YihY/UPF0761 family membrane protein